MSHTWWNDPKAFERALSGARADHVARITALTVPAVAEDPLAPSATGAAPTTHDAIKEPLLGVASFCAEQRRARAGGAPAR